MTQEFINVGGADEKQGDTPFVFCPKINRNFTELYGLASIDSRKLTICEEGDFPIQDATSITISNGFFYEIVCPITTSKYFKCLGGEVSGIVTSADFLVYTGSGDMFDVSQAQAFIKNITLSAPNGNIVSVTGDGTKTPAYRVSMSDVNVLSCLSFAKATNGGILNINNINAVGTFSGAAISLLGSGAVLQSIKSILIAGLTSTGTAIDLGSTVNNEIELLNIIPLGDPSAKFLSGLPNSGNITAGEKITVTGCNLKTLTSPLSGVTVNDIRAIFSSNPPLSNSRNAGDMYMDGATETITVSSAGVFYEIGTPVSATWLGDVADRFLVDPSGYIEYIGETPINVSITGRATVEKVGGGSNQLEVRLALNWTAGDSGQVKTKGVTQNTTPTSVPIGGLYSLVSGDKIRPIFANNDGTSNILALVTSVEISE